MKKIIVIVMIISLIFGMSLNKSIFADDINDDDKYVHIYPDNLNIANIGKPPKIDSSAAIILDAKTGRVLYEKNAFVRRAMASTTKIITAIVAIEKGNMEDIVTVSRRAASVGGSEIGLKTGDKYKLMDLMYGLMLRSGNDAAIAIAEHIGGTVEEFCLMMTKKAKEVGAKNTNFTSPHGLDNPDHYTTAYELALITQYAMKNPLFKKLVSTEQISIMNRSMHNTNELLGAYSGTNGVKTGYTGQAGRCLVTSVNRKDMNLICVVLGSGSRNSRAQSSVSLLDYSYKNFNPVPLVKKGEALGEIKVLKGIEDSVKIKAIEDLVLPLSKEEQAKLERKIVIEEYIKAPIGENVEIGSLKYYVNGKTVAETAVITASSVAKKTFKDYLGDIFIEWSRIMKSEKV